MKQKGIKVKVFHPAYGWGEVEMITDGILCPIEVEFQGETDTFTQDGRENTDFQQVLSFTDYTGTEAADWVTLDKLRERMRPKLIKGKRYKVWDDDWRHECYLITRCCNAEKKEFTHLNEGSRARFDHWEELTNYNYND